MGVIPKSVVRKFLARELSDWRDYKKLSHNECDARMERLPVKPPIWYRLDIHQKQCLLIAAETGSFFFMLGTGMGKTLLSIAIARYFKKLGSLTRALVLVPNKINKWEWQDEIEKHSPKTRFLILSGTNAEKWEQLETGDYTIAVETYQGMATLLSNLKPVKKKGKVTKKNKLRVDKKAVAKLTKWVQAIFADESTKLSNKRKLYFKFCDAIAKAVPHRFCLTGTPFGRDVSLIWGQMYLVDRGEALGGTLGLFRAAYFNEKRNYFGGFEYTFNKKMTATLHRAIAHSSISYEPKDADMPRCVSRIKYVSLPEDAETYYERAKSQLMAARGNYQEMKNAFLRMRQISSGFIGYRDDETGEKARFVFPQNPKLEAVTAWIDSVVEQDKAILFHDFVHSGNVLAEMLRGLDIEFVRVGGSGDDPMAALDTFKRKDRCRVFLLNTAAGSYGLNLQIARYGAYYESPVPVIVRKQSEKRWWRQYSPHSTVFRYDFVTRGTADESILTFHREGGDLYDTVIKGARRTY